MSQRTKILVIAGTVIALFAATGGVLAVASGSNDEKPKQQAARTTSTTTTIPATTTTTPPIIAPLTGLVDPSGASVTRPALSVKVENTPESRPQGGIDQADVLYEEVVEGNITRFVAIFNSSIPETVGPVRSVRAQDPDIVWPLGGIFVFSGGAQVNVNAVRAAPVTVVDETIALSVPGAFERNAAGQPPRSSPHNLYGHGPQLLSMGGDPKPPPALFEYLPADAPPVAGTGVLSTRIGFVSGYDPTYTWDPATRTWLRSMNGAPHTVVGGAQIAPTNVVVQFVDFNDGEGHPVGEGALWVFTDGVLRVGKWVRHDRAQAAKFYDAFGNPLHLRAGRTWVELLPAGSAVDIVEAPPPTTVPTTVPPPTTTTKAKKKAK